MQHRVNRNTAQLKPCLQRRLPATKRYLPPHAITHPWGSEMPYMAVHGRGRRSLLPLLTHRIVCRLLPQAMPQQGPDEESHFSDHHMTGRQVLSVVGMRFSVLVEWFLLSTFTVKLSRTVNFSGWYHVVNIKFRRKKARLLRIGLFELVAWQ